VQYYAAASLDGYIARPDGSIDWLQSYGADADLGDGPLADGSMDEFYAGLGALVMGSATYEWILEHESLVEHPEKWFYRDIVSFVLSSRPLPVVAGADIRFRRGDIEGMWAELLDAAGGSDIWLVGGGDLVGQFADAGHLDEVRVSVAPVTLESGKPLLPRRIESDRLTLTSVRQSGQFAELVYAVRNTSAG